MSCFFLYFRLFYKQITVNRYVQKSCRWLDSNPGPLISEATRVNCATTTAQFSSYVKEKFLILKRTKLFWLDILYAKMSQTFNLYHRDRSLHQHETNLYDKTAVHVKAKNKINDRAENREKGRFCHFESLVKRKSVTSLVIEVYKRETCWKQFSRS